MRHRAALLSMVAGLGLAACSAGTGSVPPTQPGGSPAGSPGPTTAPTQAGGLAHPTGPTEIVLRFDESGGFVPVEFMAAHVPYFTLYGDGTVVFVQAGAAVPPRTDNVSVGAPIRTTRLTEEQVQQLLVTALRDGGLAIARESYQNQMVADAPTAVFEVHADNDSKTVSVYALGLEAQPSADSAILKAMAGLGARLRDFDQGGAIPSAPYQPAAYRGVLIEQQGGVQGVEIRDWPWADIAPTDFAPPADQNAVQAATLTLTPDQVVALGVDGAENGISSGVWLRGPDGKTYSLAVRPLLPDEKA